MRTMVLVYKNLQNWVINLFGFLCWDSYSSTMLRIWVILLKDAAGFPENGGQFWTQHPMRPGQTGWMLIPPMIYSSSITKPRARTSPHQSTPCRFLGFFPLESELVTGLVRKSSPLGASGINDGGAGPYTNLRTGFQILWFRWIRMFTSELAPACCQYHPYHPCINKSNYHFMTYENLVGGFNHFEKD